MFKPTVMLCVAVTEEVTAGRGENTVPGLLLRESLSEGKTAEGQLNLY